MSYLIKKTAILFVIFFMTEIQPSAAEKTEIVLKIDGEIITNKDIKNEFNYLTILNPDLEKMDRSMALIIAKESLIKEKIKLKELVKYFDLSVEGKNLELIIKDFYQKKGLKNKNDYILYLKKSGVKYEEVKKKIQIETAWNELIYKKYKNMVKINKKILREKISKTKLTQNSYLLYEILFNDQKNVKLIEESIENIGFKNTANTYSSSNNSKTGGKIGWINENQLTENMLKNIKTLKIGEHTKPIDVNGGKLILLLEDSKKTQVNLNIEEELSKLINYERNRQLNQMSNMYYIRIKNNTLINED